MEERAAVPNRLLRQARIAHHWTQEQLAERVGVDPQTVGSWERGKRSPSLEFRGRLCEVFSLTPDQLGFEEAQTTVDLVSSSLVPSQAQQGGIVLPFRPGAGGIPLYHIRKYLLHQVVVDENRHRMLQRVRATWVDGVLRQSVGRAALLALGLLELPEALANPWRLEVQETNLPAHLLPEGTSIVEVYDDAQGELLVLGEPGSGKTTLLLELARHLLARAEENETLPIPVVLNLTSWAEKHLPLVEWIVEQLFIKYRVPRLVGREWMDTDQLILLLDGLDEVAPSSRAACVRAIDAYQRSHPLVSLVVCCRREEYLLTRTRVALQQAVLIQPLTEQQIEMYLARAGEQLDAMRRALDDDPDMLEMVKSPLLLSIVALVYQGKPDEALTLSGSLDARRRQVLAQYIQRMLARRSAGSQYTEQETMSWLSFLARQMQDRDMTEFYIERLQPDWLDPSARRRYQNSISRFIYSIESIAVAALFAWVRGGKIPSGTGVGAGLLGQLGGGPGNALLGWMGQGIGGGVEGGGSLGVLFALVFSLVTILIGATTFPVISWRASWYGARKGGSSALLTAAIVSSVCIPIFWYVGGFQHGIIYGLGMGLFCSLLIGLQSGLVAGLRFEEMRTGDRAVSAQQKFFWDRLQNGIFIGLCAGLGFALVDLLLGIAVQSIVVYGVISGVFFAVAFGFGGGSDLIMGLGVEIRPAEVVRWSWPNVGRTVWGNLVKGGSSGLVVTVGVSVAIGIASSLFYGLSYGLRYGLIYGLIVGFIAAIAAVLAGVLRSGWTSTVLDDHQIFHPNEGIRRSIRNAAFAACLFGPLGGLASGIVCGVAFGVAGELQGWLILGAGFGLAFGIIFAVLFLTIHGGIAWLSHYLLRRQLWRAGVMPVNVAAFYDHAVERVLLRKVGGGYMFAHRLLLDFFASLGASPAEAHGKRTRREKET